jgi:hypothetical protein
MKDPARATAEVVACHAIRPSPLPLLFRAPIRFNALLELDVTVPGASPYRLQQRCNAPTEKWPQAGARLPVTVDRADPQHIRIHWGQATLRRVDRARHP